MRILKELQGHFFGKSDEVLDLGNIKDLARATDVQISRYKVA